MSAQAVPMLTSNNHLSVYLYVLHFEHEMGPQSRCLNIWYPAGKGTDLQEAGPHRRKHITGGGFEDFFSLSVSCL